MRAQIPRPDHPILDFDANGKPTGKPDKTWYRWFSGFLSDAAATETIAALDPPIDQGQAASDFADAQKFADLSSLRPRLEAITQWVREVESKVDNPPGTIPSTSTASAVGANPTATASDAAVNGSALTFLRSDGAPAVQLGSSSQKGLVQVDGTSIIATSGVISATGSIGGGGNTNLATEILTDTPTAYWKCDDTSGTTIVDSGGGNFDMTTANSPTLAHSYLIPGDTAKYLRIGGTTQAASVTSALGTSPPLSGDWTIEAVVMPEQFGAANNIMIWALGLPTSEAEADNWQVSLFYNTNGTITMYWESGAGVDRLNSASPATATLVLNTPAIVACVKDGTASTLTFYRNGRQSGPVITYTTNVTGGTGAIAAFIGATGQNTTNTFVVGHIAFYNGQKISAARLRAHAMAAGLVW